MEKFLVLLLTSICLALNLATYLPPVSFYLDLITNLQGYLLFFQVTFVLILSIQFVRFRKKYLFFGTFILILLSLRIFSEIKNFYFYPQQAIAQTSKPEVSLYFAKVSSLQNIANLKQQITKQKANLIILKNSLPKNNSDLIKEIEDLTKFKGQEFSNDQGSVLIFSNFTWIITDNNFKKQGNLPSYLIARINFNQSKFTNLIFWDSLNPLQEENFYLNKAYCRRLATLVKNSTEPFLVVGSFGATPFSQCYSWFVSPNRQTRDSLWGKGFVTTWKADNMFLNLKLDHLLYNEFWKINNSTLLPSLDQINLPQSASFTLDHNFSSSDLEISAKS